MIPLIIQDVLVRETKISEAQLMLKNSKARTVFVQLANEFPDFIIGSHCGAYQKPYVFLADWGHDIIIKIEDSGEWERN